MDDLTDRLAPRLAALGLLAHPAPAIAWSGGADSTALLVATLACLRRHHGGPLPAPLLALHVNHRLRPDSDQDALACAALAAQLGPDLHLEIIDLPEGPALAAGAASIEAPARKGRYRELGAALRRAGLTAALTAHHADDNLETTLLALLRGAGLIGAAGIRPQIALSALSGDLADDHLLIARPLLHEPREALRAFLLDRDIPWREDPSNALLDRRRNRVRHELIPLLAQLGDGLAPLRRAPALFERDRAWVEGAAQGALQAARRQPWPGAPEGAVALARAELPRAQALLAHTLRAACAAAGAPYPMSADHLDRWAAAAAPGAPAPRQLEAPGLRAEISTQAALIWRADAARPAPPSPARWDGAAPLRWGGAQLSASVMPAGDLRAPPRRSWPALAWETAVEMFDQDLARPPWTVRAARPQERIPVWGGHTRSIERLLEDASLPAHTRPFWPLIEDAQGRALWLAPLRRGDLAPQTAQTKTALRLEWSWHPTL